MAAEAPSLPGSMWDGARGDFAAVLLGTNPSVLVPLGSESAPKLSDRECQTLEISNHSREMILKEGNLGKRLLKLMGQEE